MKESQYFFLNFLSAPSKLQAAIAALFDDIVLDGEGALVVGNEGVGAEPTHAVW